MCFLRFSKRKGVDDYDLYYFKDKGSIKSTSKLEALGRTLLSEASGSILTKFTYFTIHTCYKLIKRRLQKNYERNPFCGQNSI